MGWLVLVLAMWGIPTFMLKIVGTRLDNSSGALGIVVGYVIVGAILGVAGGGRLGLTWAYAIAASIGACYIIGNWAFLRLAQTQDISVLAPITSLAVVIPIALGFLMLGEPVTPRKLVGIAFALAAIVLLSDGS